VLIAFALLALFIVGGFGLLLHGLTHGAKRFVFFCGRVAVTALGVGAALAESRFRDVALATRTLG
jgi:hypothetical protein